MRLAQWRRDRPLMHAAWLIYLIVGLLLSVAYVLDHFADFISGAVGLGAVTALIVGPRWHGAKPLRPWNLLALAATLFLLGIVLRPWAVDQDGIAAYAADVCTVPGYLLMIWALVLLIGPKGRERHAVADGLIIGVGAGLVALLELAIPAASVEGRDVAVTTDFRDLFGEILTRHLGQRDLSAVFPGYPVDPARFPGVLKG